MKNLISRILLGGLLVSFFVPTASRGQAPGSGAISVTGLQCDHRVNPLGIDDTAPRFSWKLATDREGVAQGAYQIQVYQNSSETPVWDSGRTESAQSVLVPYSGPPLQSFERLRWRVRVWDDSNVDSGWSEWANWEMGVLSPSDWQADWISFPDGGADKSVPSPYLRRSFQLDGPVASARLYITSLGLYLAQINNEPVSDLVFTPGWTSYSKRLQYQVFDVTGLLRQGDNVLGAILGDGWYRGYLAFNNKRATYGDQLALLAMLRVEYRNGRVETVGTDRNWKGTTGPILMSDIYMGESYDARLEMPGWSSPGFDDSNWRSVAGYDHTKSTLIAAAGPAVRRTEELKPIDILHTPEGDTVVDMGQNMVGRIRLQVQGKKGEVVTLQHAEVLDKEGNFYTENLRAAKQTVSYTLKGERRETYEPHFTFQGFRYVKVKGWPGELNKDDLTGIVIHSDMEPTGEFECSDPLINQLQHNIVWGQKGNFLDVPTDCPQRDERLGWTGDAQVFVRTASFNMDVAAFFTKWLGDLAVDQYEDGRVPHVIPDVLPDGAGSSGWADSSVIIPWSLYVRYGDRRLLETQYPSMKAWVDYMDGQAGDRHLWTTGSHFGDWLSATYHDWSFPAAATDKDLIATSFLAHSSDLLARTAEVLGKEDDARKYRELFQHVRKAYQREFMTPAGRLSPNTQTAYALALRFDLLPEDLRAQAAQRLVEDIRRKGTHLSTGFLGTPHLCHVLSENGLTDVAYELLHQDTYPSWLYPVKKGATTIWERWDGIRPDGSFQDAGMNSFNHYAYGAIGEWLYGVVAGIQPDEHDPGFHHVTIAPEPGGKLTWARAALDSPYGRIESRWEIKGDQIVLDVALPANTHGTILLPGSGRDTRAEVESSLSGHKAVRSVTFDGKQVVIEAGPGTYQITYPWAPAAKN